MSPAVEKLKQLEQRLVAATGADRQLDAAIFNEMVDTTYPQVAFKEDNCFKLREYGRDVQCHDGWLIRRAGRLDDKYPGDLPRLSASLDAAVALCERVLPGWGYFLRKDEEGCNAALLYPHALRVTPGCGQHPTSPALALLLAIVRAVLATPPLSEPKEK